MRLRMGPVRRIRIQLRRNSWKLEVHAEPALGEQLRTQTHNDEIAIRMHGRLDVDGSAVEHKAAYEPPGPHVQRLAGRRQITERDGLAIRVHQVQTQASQ